MTFVKLNTRQLNYILYDYVDEFYRTDEFGLTDEFRSRWC